MAMEREAIRRNEYITTMVRDAIVVRHHPEQARSLSRITYRYSIVLGQHGEQLVDEMTPEQLSKADVQKLLAFFDSL